MAVPNSEGPRNGFERAAAAGEKVMEEVEGGASSPSTCSAGMWSGAL